MPGEQSAFTVKVDGLVDRIITPVEVWPAFDPAGPEPHPAGVTADALWDTGATGSFISSDLAQTLALTPVGKGEVHHEGGSEDRLRYVVNFGLPNRVLITGMLVSERLSTGAFKVILGMDVLVRGDFAITNAGGSTWVSFRMPSSARTDYRAEVDSEKYAGTRPNQPCPCGSGRKYKRCCREKVEQDRRAMAFLQSPTGLKALQNPVQGSAAAVRAADSTASDVGGGLGARGLDGGGGPDQTTHGGGRRSESGGR